MSRVPFRAAAVSVSALLALSTAVPVAYAADPVTDDPVEAAAGWLARQLADGDHMEVEFGGTTFPDAGLTADVVFALGGSGVAAEYTAAATTWLQTNAGSYLGTDFGEAYAGSFAKLILVAVAQGADPAAFGGVDLVAGLLAREQPAGRYTDLTSFDGDGDGENDDFSNVVTQSLGILSLERQGTGASAAAVDTLLSQQCADGGFPTFFFTAPDPCESDVDATGFAIQALAAAGADAQATDALDWLVSVQQADGSFQSGAPDLVSNANSTSLALQALLLAGLDEQAAAATGYLLTLQVGCSGAEADRGAIGFSSATVDGTAARASAQAVLALSGATLSDVTGTDGTEGAPVLNCPAPPTEPPADPDPEDTDTDTGAGTETTGTGSAPTLPETGTGVPAGTLAAIAAGIAVAGLLLQRTSAALRRRGPGNGSGIAVG